MTRFGAYGVLLENSSILLTKKRSGPYKNCYGLPGGALEFGETPEEALNRELKEETALKPEKVELLEILSHALPDFHQVGAIYKVYHWSKIEGISPEEECLWLNIDEASSISLTPFATTVIKKLIL